MNALFFFSIQLVIAVLICAVVVRLLSPTLHLVLADLCGADHRSRFWVRYISIILFLLPLMVILLLMEELKAGQSIEPMLLVIVLKRVMGGTIAGLILALIIIGGRINWAIREESSNQRKKQKSGHDTRTFQHNHNTCPDVTTSHPGEAV